MAEKHYGYVKYLGDEASPLFTAVMLPYQGGKFPIVVIRTPYASDLRKKTDEAALQLYMQEKQKWLDSGYAVVMQNCRGKGKSGGDCVPFVHEREDGLQLLAFIRSCDFYDGEIYLWGGSYTAEVHYLTAPYAEDIKGAVLRVKDTERYNFAYRNGCFKTSLMGDWYLREMYDKACGVERNYTKKVFDTLPLSDMTRIVYGSAATEFDEMLKHPKKEDAYWDTPDGGGLMKDALKDAPFPIMLETALYDIFEGGVFDTWDGMSEATKQKSVFLVSAYGHPDEPTDSAIYFPQGRRNDYFGTDYDIAWFDYLRGKRESPATLGKITYYNIFLNEWRCDDFYTATHTATLPLGEDTVTYTYNPYDAPEFPGGLSTNFGGVTFMPQPNLRHDVITRYTKPFANDTVVKGKMTAKLTVASDCPDTCFCMRISIEKPEGDFGLRDDITTLCHQLGDYRENSKVTMEFTFDEHAFLVKKGERLRIDISSADDNNYVRHTNQKGLFSEQTTARPAKNTVYLAESALYLPIE